MTTISGVGINSNMKETNLIKESIILSEVAFVELVVWDTPKPVAGSKHSYKYRLALVINQVCVLRYDNELGKGNHKHIGDTETEYSFTTPEQLLADFWEDVEKLT